jgi:HPt (histidine-containing phosphotransfer) domain-containing protein
VGAAGFLGAAGIADAARQLDGALREEAAPETTLRLAARLAEAMTAFCAAVRRLDLAEAVPPVHGAVPAPQESP